MGRMFIETIGDLQIPYEEQVRLHLRHNCYPPVPTIMVEPCIEAIDACIEENYNLQIDLPEGVSYRGLTTAPAHAIVSNHRLEAFIDVDDDYLEMMGE